MTNTTTTGITGYDAFDGPHLDSARWEPLRVPTPDGTQWVFEEPEARVSVGGGIAEMAVPRFTRSNDELQSPDNAKHFLISTSAIVTPERGAIEFTADMAAEKLNGSADDYRDGFATFNVFDMQSGMVFDVVSSGSRVSAIYERMAVPGVAAHETFTYVVDAPLCGLSTEPGRFHRHAITLDVETGAVRFVVDGVTIFTVPSIPVVPTQLRLGMGLMTLSPITDGRSTSLRGQGMKGRWSNFGYRTIEP
jgi:hypothetical protein